MNPWHIYVWVYISDRWSVCSVIILFNDKVQDVKMYVWTHALFTSGYVCMSVYGLCWSASALCKFGCWHVAILTSTHTHCNHSRESVLEHILSPYVKHNNNNCWATGPVSAWLCLLTYSSLWCFFSQMMRTSLPSTSIWWGAITHACFCKVFVSVCPSHCTDTPTDLSSDCVVFHVLYCSEVNVGVILSVLPASSCLDERKHLK